jgi:hypothetical protein
VSEDVDARFDAELLSLVRVGKSAATSASDRTAASNSQLMRNTNDLACGMALSRVVDASIISDFASAGVSSIAAACCLLRRNAIFFLD